MHEACDIKLPLQLQTTLCILHTGGPSSFLLLSSFHALHLSHEPLQGPWAPHLLQHMGRQHLAHLSHVHLHVVGVHAGHALLQVLGHALHHASSTLAATDEHLQAFELLCSKQHKLINLDNMNEHKMSVRGACAALGE